jgi:hypothetical protein
MDDITLEFVGPYKFWGENNNIYSDSNKNLPGIYLWTFKTNIGYLIHYVGQTTNFASRQKAQLINILGLNNGIFDASEAVRGNLKIIWKGLWRDRKNESFESELKAVYLNNKTEIIDYIEAIDIFFALLDLPKQRREHIEGTIGWNLRNNHKDYKVLYPDDNHIGTSTPYGCKLKIINTHNILGLDNEIDL